MKLDDKVSEIIDMYVNLGMTTVEIADIIGCHNTAVNNVLKRNNIPRDYRKRRGYLSQEQIKTICEQYLSGKTTVEIGSCFGLCDNTISKILKQNNIELRRGVRRSKVARHDYFRTIDTPQKAYFLGWMITDGSIVKPKTRSNRSRIVAIEIHNDDKYILELFADEIGADRSIVKYFEKRNHCHIRFASEEMANDLAKYGVVENKTWIGYLPKLDERLMPHLLRGIFDGNGTVTIEKRSGTIRFAYYGSKQVCEDVRDYLHEKIGINKNKVSKSTCYYVWWGGPTPSKKFSEFIYKDCGEYFLIRKYEKFNCNKSTYHENTEITNQIA